MVHELLQVGTLFDGRYEIRSVAGQGGTATVYRAYQQALGREVALKVLHPNRAADGDQIKRFKLEAHLLSTLSHPNITSVRAFGTTAEGLPYVAFELLHGTSLAEIIDNRDTLTSARFFKLFSDACRGLQFAHEHRIVHRDLKPGNIFVINANTPDEMAKILDFGIAKALADGPFMPQNLTATGDLLGTPLYMSPEQCRGEKADQRSDIYSIGCVMYQWLTGAPPFTGASAYEVLYGHDRMDAPDVVLPPGYPPSVATIVGRCLKKDPQSRYQSAQQLQADLGAVRGGKELTGQLPRAKLKLKQKASSKKLALLAITISITTMGGIGLAWPWIQKPLARWQKEPELRSNWERGNYKPLQIELDRAYGTHDFLWARYLINAAKSSLSMLPSVEGANIYSTGLWYEHGVNDRKPYQTYGWRILNSLPDRTWKNSDTVLALESLHNSVNKTVSPSTQAGHRMLLAQLVEWLDSISIEDRPEESRSVATEAIKVGHALATIELPVWLHMLDAERSFWLAGRPEQAHKIGNFLSIHHPIDVQPERHRINLLQLEAEAFSSEGKTRKALEKLLEARSLLADYGLFSQAAAVHFEIGNAYLALHDKQHALVAFAEALAECRESGDPELRLEYLSIVGNALHFAGSNQVDSALSSLLDKPVPTGAHPNIGFAKADALLARERYKEAYQAWAATTAFGAPFEQTPFGRWAAISSLKIPISQQFDLMEGKADPKQVRSARDTTELALTKAALAAASGDYQNTAKRLKDTADILASVEHPLAPKMLLEAARAGRIGTWRGYWVELCKQVLNNKTSPVEVKVEAAVDLGKAHRLSDDLPVAASYIETARKLCAGNPSYDVICEGSLVYGQQENWAKVLEVSSPLTSEMRRKATLDWLRKWGDPYAMALRQSGNPAEADALLLALESRYRTGEVAKITRPRV